MSTANTTDIGKKIIENNNTQNHFPEYDRENLCFDLIINPFLRHKKTPKGGQIIAHIIKIILLPWYPRGYE